MGGKGGHGANNYLSSELWYGETREADGAVPICVLSGNLFAWLLLEEP